MSESKVLYRYESVQFTDGLQVCCSEFLITKETPCGYWIDDYNRLFPKWVSKTSLKRYAYPIKLEAMHSFVKRKERQITILTYQLQRAKDSLELSDRPEGSKIYNHYATT